jgi:hypothetical protein
MNKFVNNKNIYRGVLIVSFIGLNLLLLVGVSLVLDYLNTGANRNTMLHLEKENVSTYLPKVDWISTDNPARKMEKIILERIQTDYLLSWYVKNNAFLTNADLGIDDYFTQNPRLNLRKSIAFNKKNNISIESTTLEHHPKLEFYSEDGQLVVFTDKNVVEFQNFFKNKQLLSSVKDTATYKVMMLLEDGFWRVRHFQKMKPEAIQDTIVPTTEKIYTVNGPIIEKNNIEFKTKGINYYPKNAAWNTFDSKFSLTTISNDFDIIKAANLNTIRIFLQYEDFGKSNVNELKLYRLKALLDLAESKELAVVVTLFDFYGDYALNSWTQTQVHAAEIVSKFKDHQAIMAWDIKNEPNLDFESRGKTNVLNWLEQMAHVIKQNDPNHLITIGWADTAAAIHLQNVVDFISFHYYHPLNQFQNEINWLNQATEKPLVMQEFGVSSYSGVWNLFSTNENKQAQYHKEIQSLIKTNNLAFISWTLYDFPEVPNAVVGRWPWQKQQQKHFGFIDTHGKQKPAFEFISN